MFKLLTSLLISFAFFTSSLSANEISLADPYVMIQKVAEKTFKRFVNERSAIKENPNLLKNIVSEELLPYINYKYSAYKVLGLSNLKKMTKEQRAEFVEAFKDFLVTEYAQVFTLYNNQEVQYESSKDTKESKILAIKTVIIQPGTDPIDIAFKVKKNKKTLEWKAFDMVALGVSLLDSKKAELNAVIRKEGLPYVIKMLNDKSKRNIEFKKL